MAFTDFYKPLNPIDPQIRMNPIQQQTAKDIYTFLENQRQQQQLNIQQQNAQIQQAQMQQQADARRVEAEKSREKALKQIEEQNAFKQALADLSERQKADPNMTIFQQQRVIRESLQGQGQVGLVKALDNKMLEAHTKSKDPVYQNAIQSGYFGGKAQTPEELAKLARVGKSPIMVADRPFDVATEEFIAPEKIGPALEEKRRLSEEEWNRRQQVLEKSKMAVKAAPSGASLGGGGGGGPEETSAEELKLLSGVDAILNPPSGGGGGGGGGVGAGASVGVSAGGAEVGITPDITFTPEPTPGVASETAEPAPGVASETAIPMAAGPEQEIPKIMEALNYLSRITPQVKSKAGQAALRARRTELIMKLNQANKQIARMEKEEEKKGKKLTPEAVEDHVKLNIATGKKPDISPRNMEAWTDYTNARAQYLRANNIPLWVILRNEANYEAKKKTVSFLDKKNAVMRGYVDTITSNIKDVKLGMELLKKEFGSSPLYNEFRQNFMTRVYASDPEKSAQVGRLRAALDIIAKEVANAVSNPNMVGVTPESIQQEMIKKLNAAQTYEQVMATLNLYEKDLMNRVNASQKTQDDAINSLSGLFPETAKNFQGWKPDQTTPLPVPPRGVKPVVNQYYQNSKGSILMHNGKNWIWIDKNE